ncbi:MAG: 2-phospho-L-lactate guanylyltransferase [Micrococcales bacterium]|nr:MAG: 2-phospho-L-lactate guanylyltransferase [Micrococcales bacterium]
MSVGELGGEHGSTTLLSRPRWGVVVAHKGGPAAKRRLAAGLADRLGVSEASATATRLATAMARDVLASLARARRVGSIVVVCSADDAAEDVDGWLRTSDTPTQVRVLVQPAALDSDHPDATLNSALSWAARHYPTSRHEEEPVALLAADLPAVTAADIDTALAAADALFAATAADTCGQAFVPDVLESGTVMLAGRSVQTLRPRFGPASATAHARAGATALELPLPGLRIDVDRTEDLARVARLGIGPHTAAALAELDLV